jgi:Uri superfamily endonuclease
VQPAESGSAYRKENKAVDRISESSKASVYKKRWHRLYLAEIRRLLAFWYFSLHQERGRAKYLWN